jgi:hypothetical protein
MTYLEHRGNLWILVYIHLDNSDSATEFLSGLIDSNK